MFRNKQKKQRIAKQLAMALRAYNALLPPAQWKGDEEIDALYSAIAYNEEELDFVVDKLITAVEEVHEENTYTEQVRILLKRARRIFNITELQNAQN